MTTSPIFANAMDLWRECREAYALHLEAQYSDAERECRGVLLNKRGRAAGIAADSLFLGPAARAHAYASEELLTYWQAHPRVTYAAFERGWWSQ